MALDTTFDLRNWSARPCERYFHLGNYWRWRDLVHKQFGRAWAVRLVDDTWFTLDGDIYQAGKAAPYWRERFGNRWIIFQPDASFPRFENVLQTLDSGGGNAYGRIGETGAVFLVGRPSAELIGGSFARSLLVQEDDRLAVLKCIHEGSSDNVRDSCYKLRREHEYLSKLDTVASGFFPSLVNAHLTREYFGFTMEFIHEYSLAERMFQGTISPEETVEVLTGLLSQMTRHLYDRSHEPGEWTCQERSIAERTLRRFHALICSDGESGEMWQRLLSARSIIINEEIYAGWPVVREWLCQVKPLKNMLSAERCHGDLIFDHILVSFRNNNWKLIDPNGDATSRMYDLGKLTLSLLSAYEFFKYNYYRCEAQEMDSGRPVINFSFEHNESLEHYALIAKSLPLILRDSRFFDGLSPIGGGQLYALNGLHNASLPYFHYVHHQDSERAIGFFSMAIVRLNQAMHAWNRSKSIRIEEVIESCTIGILSCAHARTRES